MAASRARPRLPLLALAFAMAAAAGPARAADLNGRADLSVGDESLDEGSSRYFRQRYDLEVRQAVSEALGYGLRLRLQEDRGESTLASGSVSTLRRSAAARGEGGWHREEYSASTRYELDWSGDDSPLGPASNERWLQRANAGGRWRVSEPLELLVSGEHSDARAPGSDPSVEDKGAVSAELTLADLRILESNVLQRTADGSAERISGGPRFALDWNRTLGQGARVAARYQGDWSWSSERSLSASTVQVAVGVSAISGLFVWTDLPADTTATPMVATPGLLDGNFVAGTGVPIGPTGVWFQNVGLDLGRVTRTDELRITIRSSTGNLVPIGGGVTWSPWWSNDGLHWTRAGGGGTSYDVALGAYVVTFSPVAARYVKAVSDATHALDAEVTELQAYAHDPLRPREDRRTRSILQSLSLSATATATEKLLFTYAGTFNASGATLGDAPTAWTTDTAHTLSALAGPFEAVTLGLSLTDWEFRQQGVLQTRNLAATSTATWKPAPAADVAVTARAGELTEAAVSAFVWGGGLRGALAWYQALRLDGSIDFTRQELDDGSSDYVSASANAAARVRPELELSASAGLQRATATRGATELAAALPLLTVYEYERYQAGVTWRPSPQLQLDLRAGAVHVAARFRFVESLRGVWNPFRDSAFQLAADYANEVDPSNGRSYQRLQIAPRWTLNPHANLQVYYSRQRISGDVESAQDAVYLTFSLRT
jgi:hypothetical protein